ncbi:Hypothetical protein D9617_171g078100 [Elsinoe fawcettii]|nr:Hypothetical protein D9617_171g078100 [Elsinoe fawcettii]
MGEQEREELKEAEDVARRFLTGDIPSLADGQTPQMQDGEVRLYL